MPDLDYITQHRKILNRKKKENYLTELLVNRDLKNDYSYLGSLRELMAPDDTLAFPPNVLDKKVSSYQWLPEDAQAIGLYRLDNPDTILLSPRYNPDSYETLLHEAGHARGHAVERGYVRALASFFGDPKKHKPDIDAYSEEYADRLKDSLISRKIPKGGIRKEKGKNRYVYYSESK